MRPPTSDPVGRGRIRGYSLDYLGTGESAGDLSINNLVDEWRTNIAAAIAYARDLANGPVIAVGLRMGATLLSEQLPTLGELGALVLWDPVRKRGHVRPPSKRFS